MKRLNEKTWLGLCYVMKTIDLIMELLLENPKMKWFMENPRGMLRKQKQILSQLPYNNQHTVTYCQYGDKRQKPTDIWTNLFLWESKPMCSPGSNCHESAKRGSSKGTQGLSSSKTRSEIPAELFIEIFKVLEESKNSSGKNDYANLEK